MNLLIVIGIVAFIIASVRYFRKVDNDPNHPYNIKSKDKAKIDANIDRPISFGYKCRWFAIKTDDQLKVANLLGLNDPKTSNWKSGVESAYYDSIFITPPLDNWILAVGWGLPTGDSKESLKKVKNLLTKLSSEFGEAHYFCTHRVVESHCWAKSTEGSIDRIYSYLGERAENIDIVGEPTQIEKSHNLIDTISEKAQNKATWDDKELVYPDEELVIKIAADWSINPTELDQRKDFPGLGLLGKRNNNQ